MELRELNLIAYGPFTDKKLIFDQDKAGFYVIYGPNEAGKSSALRGLKSLLYGIPGNTTDNFIHENSQLRIGGYLRAANGHELRFFRRKGLKNTLLAPDDTALDELALSAFLSGASADIFNTLFGIDHHELEIGGEEILKQKGEVGQALFAAALGSPALHSILDDFDNEADSLFRGRGTTQKITVALKKFTDLKKRIREESLSSAKWTEHRRAFSRTTKALAEIQAELAQSRAEITRLQRVHQVLPKFAQRLESRQKFEDMGDVIVLANDFSERHQNTVTELDKARAAESQATSRLKDLQQQLGGINVLQDILNQAETIEAMHEQLGGYRKAMQDRPGLIAKRDQLLTDVDTLLKEIRPGHSINDIEILRPILTKRTKIIELGSDRKALVERAKQTELELREKELRLEELQVAQRELPETQSPDTLNKVIAAARRSGDVDTEVNNSSKERQNLEAQCVTGLKRLPYWPGHLPDVQGLSVPVRENIDRFEHEYEALNSRVQRLQEKRDDLATANRVIERDLDELQRAGTVPSEQELEQARTHRDQGWRLLRRKWLDKEDVAAEAEAYAGERTLPDAYESQVLDTDELADRLRREADRVQKLASLTASQEDYRQQTEEITQQLAAHDVSRSELDQKWTVLWQVCEIEPQTPREMRRWLDDFTQLQERVAQLEGLRQKAADVLDKRNTHIQAINRELQGHGKTIDEGETSLESVLHVAEALALDIQKTQQYWEQLNTSITALTHDIKIARSTSNSANKELDEWKAQWQAIMVQLNLESEALPAEANNVVEKIRQLFTNQKDAEQLAGRIQSIDEDANAFQTDVKKLIERVAPDLAERPIEQAIAELNVLLTQSRTDDTRHKQIQYQIQQAKQDVQQAKTTIDTMSDRLVGLCAEAHCQSPDQLDETQRLSDQFQQLRSTVEVLEREILEAGEGSTLLELENEIEIIDPVALPGQIQALHDSIQNELEPRQTELAEEKGRQQKELELMDGSDKAAQLAEQAQSELAQIQHDAERYIQLKLSGRILRQEIERYRNENQGPLVKRASEHFSKLTSDSFKALRTDYNEKDEPILVGVKPDNTIIRVEGMSSGTRDQLYLALRLASLEKFMENSEPMPFIVDDVLINYDDERAMAALNSLFELAQNTQVILFTHHTKTVEQSKLVNKAINIIEL